MTRAADNPQPGISEDSEIGSLGGAEGSSFKVVWSPVQGYDLAAPHYDAWHWQEFWRKNEHDHVLSRIPKGGRYADIGCGTGAYFRALLKLGSPIGVDPSRNMLEVARRNLPGRADLRIGSARGLPLEDGFVDVALTTRVLSHESELAPAVREIGRVIKPGGTWLVTDIHAGHPYSCTRIPTPQGDLHIETSKRTPEKIAAIALKTGLFVPIETKVFFAKDLTWQPMRAEFPRIDRTGTNPVFFLQTFGRL